MISPASIRMDACAVRRCLGEVCDSVAFALRCSELLHPFIYFAVYLSFFCFFCFFFRRKYSLFFFFLHFFSFKIGHCSGSRVTAHRTSNDEGKRFIHASSESRESSQG